MAGADEAELREVLREEKTVLNLDFVEYCVTEKDSFLYVSVSECFRPLVPGTKIWD